MDLMGYRASPMSLYVFTASTASTTTSQSRRLKLQANFRAVHHILISGVEIGASNKGFPISLRLWKLPRGCGCLMKLASPLERAAAAVCLFVRLTAIRWNTQAGPRAHESESS
jgi:hypothetical protein